MRTNFIIFFIIYLITISLPSNAPAQYGSVFANYQYSVTEDGAFGLYKPKGWKVSTEIYPNGRRVYVVDPANTSHVNMTFLENISPKLDAVGLATTTLRNYSSQVPSVKVREVRSDRARMHVMMTYQRRGPNNVLIQGRYHFNVKSPTAVICGYEAPAGKFKQMASTLLTTIANITILDRQAYQKRVSQMSKRGPIKMPMNQMKAPDNTCWLKVPQGWNFTAGKGAALCKDANGNAGYFFTFINFVGRSRIPYFDSRNIPGDLRYEYMRPIDALITFGRHTGSRNHRVLERYANPSGAREASARLRRGTDAETALVAYVSKDGVPLVGYYDVLGMHPDNAGQWGLIAIGFWAPQNQFGQYLPILLEIAESFRVNMQWASNYVFQGMQRVRKLMQQTSSMMSQYAQEMRASNLAGHRNRMRSSDFLSYKFSTYMRGEQEWVTSLEGGKLYSTNHYGLSSGGRLKIEGQKFNYYNYQGDTQYGHVPLDVSREVFEAVKGGY